MAREVDRAENPTCRSSRSDLSPDHNGLHRFRACGRRGEGSHLVAEWLVPESESAGVADDVLFVCADAKPALAAVVFPALLLSFPTGANNRAAVGGKPEHAVAI